MTDVSQMDELAMDAIAELMNMAMGQAASALNEIVHEEVTLSVPSVRFVSGIEFSADIARTVDEPVSVVDQHIEGPFAGDVLLIFPEAKSLELVRSLLGDEITLEELTELEQDALIEIGNILIGALVSTFADVMGCRFESALPQYAKRNADAILRNGQGASSNIVLSVTIAFRLPSSEIDGYLSVVMSAGSMARFRDMIDDFVESISS
jgi:chemotaxis protein CheC